MKVLFDKEINLPVTIIIDQVSHNKYKLFWINYIFCAFRDNTF